ncbi:MAG: LarC family nickel insertion protein, partial [Acidobacteriota bacterium]|nr:LarC family nickel insertion protein [Acidobacteriota bacterium]
AVELTTPTGAAVVAALAQDFGSMPAMTISSVGYGAGDKDFIEHANVLRVVVGQPSGASEATAVTVIEANIDDSTPQVLAYAVERLMEAGALDASLQHLEMKKGRPGSLLRVITRPERRDAMADIIFAETSALGMRMFPAERRVQARRWMDVETGHGTVRMKIGGDDSFAPEYEDCRALALSTRLPLRKIIAAANQAYLQLTK